MNASANPIFQKAEKTVRRLIEECQPNGNLYHTNPKTITQIRRTGKWLLSAIARLNKEPKNQKEENQ